MKTKNKLITMPILFTMPPHDPYTAELIAGELGQKVIVDLMETRKPFAILFEPTIFNGIPGFGYTCYYGLRVSEACKLEAK